MPSIEPDFKAELVEIQAESIGWIPLEEGVYLHQSSEGKEDPIVITGVRNVGVDGENVLLVL